MSEIRDTETVSGEEKGVEVAMTATKEPPPEHVGRPQDAHESVENTTETVPIPGHHPGISHRRLLIIVFGLCLTIFLIALDQTIVSTAVPTIVEDLGDSSGYTWIGTSYLLASYPHPGTTLIAVPFPFPCTEEPLTFGDERRFCLSRWGSLS